MVTNQFLLMGNNYLILEMNIDGKLKQQKIIRKLPIIVSGCDCCLKQVINLRYLGYFKYKMKTFPFFFFFGNIMDWMKQIIFILTECCKRKYRKEEGYPTFRNCIEISQKFRELLHISFWHTLVEPRFRQNIFMEYL